MDGEAASNFEKRDTEMFQTAQVVRVGSAGQDRVLVQKDDSTVVLAVADGAGGRSGGAEAADMAVGLIYARATSLKSRADCEQLLVELDRAIAGDRVAGETTCVLVVIRPTGVFGASVGDSGAWAVGTFGIDDLTNRQVRKPFLGTGTAAPVGFARSVLDGTIMVATDGLLKYASQERIGAAVLQPELNSIPNELVSLVRYPSGALPDDIAIALCRYSS